MSLFKEKDDLIRRAFQHLENDNSDLEDEEEADDQDATRGETSKGESFSDNPNINDVSRNSKQSEKNEPSIGTGSQVNEVKPTQDGPESDDVCYLDESISENDCVEVINANDIYQILPAQKRVVQENQVFDISSSDDDDEVMDITPRKSNSSILKHNTSIEDRDFTLKITLAGAYRNYITTYKVPIVETLRPLLNELSSQGKRLKLYHGDREIPIGKSPLTLQLKPGSLLQAIEVPLVPDPVDEEEVEVEQQKEEPAVDTNAISLKLQDGNRKHTKDFRISIKEPLGKLKNEYAQAFNIESNVNIRLFFDGDEIDDESTAEELELEDGFAVDVVIA